MKISYRAKKWIKISGLTILIVLALYFGYRILSESIIIFNSNKSEEKDENEVPEQQQSDEEEKSEEESEEKEQEKPTLQIYDLDSNERPIGLMIDNESGAWPHAGLQDAFLIYEMIIEGGQTRLFALFKDKNTSMIGPIRSARHYYIDYALENDSIFTHFGYSPQAYDDLNELDIDNISGTQSDGSAFWREEPLGSYHNVFTSISKLQSRINSKGYDNTTDYGSLLNYSIEEVNLNEKENYIIANNIKITYSSSHYVTYEYDSEEKVYKRSMRGESHVDRITDEQYTVKNIIVYKVRNYDLNDGSGKGRQGLDNIGDGTGYYITNGYAIPITWEKTSRTGRTIYEYQAEEEIHINDGNTFIHLQPLYKNLDIE